MISLRTALVGISAIALSSPALAQDHSTHDMPGMEMPPPPKAKRAKVHKPAAPPTPAPAPAPAPPPMPAEADRSAMDQGAMDGMGMPEAADAQSKDTATGTDQPAGSESPPPPPRDRYADRQFPPAEMARAHYAMMKDSGGQSFGAVILNIAEYQAHRGRDGYRWDGEAFYGGDINRLWIKSEGEGELRRGLDSGEVQVLYSRAVDPYFNLQVGVRQDIGPTPRRTYATIGFEGLAPGMFEVEGGLFLSNKGDLLGRLEGYYDQRIIQRLILQPRVELNFAAQDVPENAIGSGLSNVELGARLRYEFSRQFAPYIGVSYYRKLGDTARFARTAGEDVHATSVVAGIRFWF